MIEFNIKYFTEIYNKINPLKISEGKVDRPLYIKWHYEGIDYEFVKEDDNFAPAFFVSQKFIIVCYSEKAKDYTYPNNVVLYNLKKEIIKIIAPPTPINWDKISPIYSIGEVKTIENEEHIAIYIGEDNYFLKEKGVIGFIEIRWLNLKTFEYHPTENTFIKDYGR